MSKKNLTVLTHWWSAMTLRVDFTSKFWSATAKERNIWVASVVVSDWICQSVASYVTQDFRWELFALGLLSLALVLFPVRFVKVMSILLVTKAFLSLGPFLAMTVGQGSLGSERTWEIVAFFLVGWVNIAMVWLLVRYIRTPRAKFEN